MQHSINNMHNKKFHEAFLFILHQNIIAIMNIRKEMTVLKILKLLSNKHAMTIMKIVNENDNIRTTNLFRLCKSSSDFYVYLRQLAELELLDKNVHNDSDRSVTYSVSAFGKTLLGKRDEIKDLVDNQFTD